MLAVPAGASAFEPEIASATERVRYDYRLVLSRKLYDRAVTTVHSPSLAPLAQPGAAHVHPLDLDGIGVAAGTEVRIVASKGTVVLPIEGDVKVPRGSLLVPFNVDGVAISDILDITAPAVDVRVERLS